MTGDLISVEETRKRILDSVRPLPAEAVPTADALGRVLAADVIAGLDLPPFDSSAMDGFAVIAGPAAVLDVVGESRAGSPWDGVLEQSQATRISTGAVVPAGADAVVPVERVEVAAGGGELDAHALPRSIRVPDVAPGAHIRRAGEDVRAGQVVMGAGRAVGPAELGMLAALGHVDASCARRPALAVVATGDELVAPGAPLGPGQIHDSNAAAVGAQALLAGALAAGRCSAGDELATTREALAAALESADVVCISGGVSVGPHDHVRPALAELGVDQRIWGVRLKPGKPFFFGVRDEPDARRRYVFGLPGNPVSAMVTFALFVRPALRALQGADPAATRVTAVLDGPVKANPQRDQAVRCRLHAGDDGWHVEPTGPQGSHVLSSMIGAAALALVPAGERDLAPRERVDVELM